MKDNTRREDRDTNTGKQGRNGEVKQLYVCKTSWTLVSAAQLLHMHQHRRQQSNQMLPGGDDEFGRTVYEPTLKSKVPRNQATRVTSVSQQANVQCQAIILYD